MTRNRYGSANRDGQALVGLVFVCLILLAVFDWLVGQRVSLEGVVLERSWEPSKVDVAIVPDAEGGTTTAPVVRSSKCCVLVETESGTFEIDTDRKRFGHVAKGDRVRVELDLGWSGITYRRRLAP